MKKGFLVDFESRKAQLKRYLAFVSREEKLANPIAKRFQDGRLNVMRAGTFLILYNLVESSARSAIQAIHDDLQQHRVPFHYLRRTIRFAVVKGFKRHGQASMHQDMSDLPVDLVAAALQVEDHFSGNVDARLLREIAEVYGFSCVSGRSWTRGGADLLTIKTVRNDLAHGLKTYDEIGRNYSFRDLLGMSVRGTSYVSDVLTNISGYLDSAGYRKDVAEAA